MHVRPSPAFLTLLLAAAVVAGCVRPPVAPPPEDTGDALPVPRMSVQPVLDEHVGDEEWAETLVIAGQFDIRDGTLADGTYPFTLRIGATEDALHFAAQVPDFPENPWNHDGTTYSDCIGLYFTDRAPRISRPSFFVGACTGVSGYTTVHLGYWNGADWVIPDEHESGAFNQGRPTGGTWVFGNVLNGTMFFEGYTPRFPKDTAQNGLDLVDGSTFRMCLMFMRIGGNEPGARSPDARGNLEGPHDTYPEDGYTPDGLYNSSAWFRLRMPG